MSEASMERHDLAWLVPAEARHAVPVGDCRAGSGDNGSAPALLADWVAAGRPLIVARQAENDEPGSVRLGLALPPALGKRRLAFRVPLGAVARVAPPPPLAMAATALPQAWQPLLCALLEAPAIVTAQPRVYGSAAMQAFTGLQCLGEDSDLDLLLDPPDWLAALAAVDALKALESRIHSPRMDGEIRNGVGEAVAWRELASAATRVLTKGRRDVRLTDRSVFAAGFAPVEPER